jgi:hypothetical protein
MVTQPDNSLHNSWKIYATWDCIGALHGVHDYGPDSAPRLAHRNCEKLHLTLISKFFVETNKVEVVPKLWNHTREIEKIPAGQSGV